MSVNFEELYDEFLFFAPPVPAASAGPVINQGISQSQGIIMAEPHTHSHTPIPSPSPMVIYEGQTTTGNNNGNNGNHQSQQLQQQQPFYPPTINHSHSHSMNSLASGGYNHPPSHIHHHLPNQQQQQQHPLLSQQLASNSNNGNAGNGSQTYIGHQAQQPQLQQLQQPAAGIVYENNPNHLYQIRQQPYHANYHVQPAPQQQQVHQILPQHQQHVQRPQQQQQQQQQVQQQQWFQPHGHGSLVQPFVPQNVVNNNGNGTIMDHPQLYPGGLEILWRELPFECQRLIDPQDVPETARFRGYFTVCELIALKRTLQSRYTPAVHQQLQQQQQQLQLQHQQLIQQKQAMQAQLSNQQQQNVATTTSTTNTTITSTNLNGIKPTSGGGGKITKPKKVPQHAQTMVRVPANQTQQQISATVDHAVRETLISLGQGQGHGQSSGENSANNEKNLTTIENSSKGQEVNGDLAIVENQGNTTDPKATISEGKESKTATSTATLTISNSNTTNTTTTTTENDDKALGLPSNLTTAPNATNPSYRTASLVFKLLQIGNYNFRTFSDNNPNKLRIIFNSQRISYECQLPMVQPPRDSLQPLRKLLMIDVSFDQITMIKFGADKLLLRVEGPPLLTVTYHPSSEPYCGPPPLTPQDVNLLEQIDKGQLKLNPYHQLFFLNERLVHLLECQFKEHPRFKHLMEKTDKAPV